MFHKPELSENYNENQWKLEKGKKSFKTVKITNYKSKNFILKSLKMIHALPLENTFLGKSRRFLLRSTFHECSSIPQCWRLPRHPRIFGFVSFSTQYHKESRNRLWKGKLALWKISFFFFHIKKNVQKCGWGHLLGDPSCLQQQDRGPALPLHYDRACVLCADPWRSMPVSCCLLLMTGEGTVIWPQRDWGLFVSKTWLLLWWGPRN